MAAGRGVDYDQHQHRVFVEGRRHPEGTRQLWRDLIVAAVGAHRIEHALDVGSGTGRFTPQLADLLDAEVIGVEPSARMRSVAERESVHPRVRYVAGDATSLPVASGSQQLAWMSAVWHHVTDPAACARELTRVLCPGGLFLLRNGFVDTHLDSTFYRYFPAARSVDAPRLPRLGDTIELLESHGLALRARQSVEQETDPSLSAFAERMRLRPFSTFELMTEDAIDAGMRALDEAIAAGVDTPVYEYGDLLTFEVAP